MARSKATNIAIPRRSPSLWDRLHLLRQLPSMLTVDSCQACLRTPIEKPKAWFRGVGLEPEMRIYAKPLRTSPNELRGRATTTPHERACQDFQRTLKDVDSELAQQKRPMTRHRFSIKLLVNNNSRPASNLVIFSFPLSRTYEQSESRRGQHIRLPDAGLT